MKSSTLKIVLLSICVILLSGLLIYSLIAKDSIFKFKINDNAVELYNDEYLKEDVNEIKVDCLSTDVIIEKSDTDKIKIVISGDEDNKNKYSVKISSGKIEIKEKVKHVVHIGFYMIDENITIYIPDDYDKKLDISTASGDLTINDNFVFKLKAKLISGDIDAINLADVDINTTSGDINLKEVKDANVKSVSGDIEIGSVNNIDVESTSGDVKIGSININKDCKIKTISGDVRINKANDIYIETKTVSGNDKIKNNNRLADFTLKIETTSGDINVN